MLDQIQPGKLVLVRHGASEWNQKNIFTGWTDVPLSKKGITEAHLAAKKLKKYKFDIAFTSILIRAIDTLDIILRDLDQLDIPIFKNQALNERHYGDLQGKNKDETSKQFGAEQVRLWRRSYDVAPPNGESLKDTCARTLPCLQSKILPKIKAGQNVLVSAHGNSLRSIVMYLENLKPEEIIEVNIPTGIPYVYEFGNNLHIKNKTILSS